MTTHNNNNNNSKTTTTLKRERENKSKLLSNNKTNESFDQVSPMSSFINGYNKINANKLANVDTNEKIKYDLDTLEHMLDELDGKGLCSNNFITTCRNLREHNEELLEKVKIERENMKDFVCNSLKYWAQAEEGKKRRKYTRQITNNNNNNNNSNLLSNNQEAIPVSNDIKTNINNIVVPNNNESITTETTNIYLKSVF